jgi:hypothetical protein
MLYLVVVFGDAMDDHVGLWTWPFLLVAVAIIGFVRNRIFGFGPAVAATIAPPLAPHPRRLDLFSHQLVARGAEQSRTRWFKSLQSVSKSMPR